MFGGTRRAFVVAVIRPARIAARIAGSPSSRSMSAADSTSQQTGGVAGGTMPSTGVGPDPGVAAGELSALVRSSGQRRRARLQVPTGASRRRGLHGLPTFRTDLVCALDELASYGAGREPEAHAASDEGDGSDDCQDRHCDVRAVAVRVVEKRHREDGDEERAGPHGEGAKAPPGDTLRRILPRFDPLAHELEQVHAREVRACARGDHFGVQVAAVTYRGVSLAKEGPTREGELIGWRSISWRITHGASRFV